MPYVFKASDIVWNDRVASLAHFAIQDFIDGCQQVYGDNRIGMVAVNLTGMRVQNGKKLSATKSEFEYYVKSVPASRIVETEELDPEDVEEDIVDVQEFLEGLLDDYPDLYIHFTCASALKSISTMGLSNESKTPFKIWDREEPEETIKGGKRKSRGRKTRGKNTKGGRTRGKKSGHIARRTRGRR